MAHTTPEKTSEVAPVALHPAQVPPKPDIRIGGAIYRSDTFPAPASPILDEIPEIDDPEDTPLDTLLRKYDVTGRHGAFMPHKRLLQIFSRPRVLAKLQTCTELKNTEEYYLELIRPANDQLTIVDFEKPKHRKKSTSTKHTYLRTFALLVRQQEENRLDSFIEDQVSDQNLPVRFHEGSGRQNRNICLESDPEHILPCFGSLALFKRESFHTSQSEYLVPFFDFNTTKHLYKEHRLPWCQRENVSHISAQPSVVGGGYALVSRQKIHPLAHGFQETLRTLGLTSNIFAIKKLKDIDPKTDNGRFRNELEQLQRFNGLIHEHLVTLLATFVKEQKYYFIFPYALGTLDDYWEFGNRNPKLDRDTIQWIAKQCWGLTSALSTIHEPKYLHEKGIEKYGRHGDIKPDNILRFPSSENPRGILVVSDMGLTAFNSKVSRSEIPQNKVQNVPASYRGPELDVEGGVISRLYDIWTLGCLYLEMFTWLLKGFGGLEEFQESRGNNEIPNKNGSRSRDFFSLLDITNPEETHGLKVNGDTGGIKRQYIAQVKDEVKLCFGDLHSADNCSMFIHEALDIVENEMLVILSKDSEGNKRLRTKSSELETKFEQLYQKCKNEADYCTKGVPKQRITRKTTGVKVTVTEETAEEIAKNKLSVGVYRPHANKKHNLSLSREELTTLDQINPPNVGSLNIKET